MLLHPCDMELPPHIVQGRGGDPPLLIRHEKDRLARIVHNKVSLALSIELERPSRWRLDREMLSLVGNADRNSGGELVLSSICIQQFCRQSEPIHGARRNGLLCLKVLSPTYTHRSSRRQC